MANSEEFLSFCSGLRIRVEPIAGEAPWQMGKHSRHLEVLLNTVLDLMTELECPLDEACIRACMSKNERATIRGFTPVQCMLGRQDPILGSVVEGNLGEIAAALDDTTSYRENLE